MREIRPLPQIRGFFDFWTKASGRAASRAWGIWGVITTVAPYVFAGIGKYVPSSGLGNAHLVILILNHPLRAGAFSLSIAFIPFLFRAPFDLFKDLQQSKEELESEVLALRDGQREELIASVSAVASVNVATANPTRDGTILSGGDFAGGGGGGKISLVKPDGDQFTEILSVEDRMYTVSNSQPGSATYTIEGAASPRSPVIGKKLSEILTSTSIIITYPHSTIAPKTKILGGHVLWIINARRLTFIVPPQEAAADGFMGVVTIKELADGLSCLNKS